MNSQSVTLQLARKELCDRSNSYICVYICTECPGWNVPEFGRMFLKLKYTDVTNNTYIRN